jgi:hypothetical protein
MSFGCGPSGEALSILKGEGGGFPQVWAMVNLSLLVVRPNTKSAPTMH